MADSGVEMNKGSTPPVVITGQQAALPTGEGAEKVYHVRYPGSTFVDRTGVVHMSNAKGELKTKSLALQQELDALSDKAGSPWYTKDDPVIDESETRAVDDVQSQAARAIAQLNKQQKS